MENTRLGDIFKLFFKMGLIAFGGPAAHIAMMEDEVVRKRKWMDEQHFLDLMGATNLIPGPNSTEMTMHCGLDRGGWKGLIIAGASFIFPAVVITAIFAWLYQTYGHYPQVEPFIYGIKPAVIAIILFAVYRLGKKALKSVELGILGILTIVVCFLGVHEIWALLGCGVLGILLFQFKKATKLYNSIIPILFLQMGAPLVKLGGAGVFWTFLKIGSILYGSGYVLFAFLDAELVSKGIMDRQVIMDAVAVGQMTPGPVLTTATFIGWQLEGFWGAILATTGIFLPSFVFVYFLNGLIPKMQKSKIMRAFLDAVNIAAVAVIIVVCVEMGIESVVDLKTTAILVISIMALFFVKRISSLHIVLFGAFGGYLLSLF